MKKIIKAIISLSVISVFCIAACCFSACGAVKHGISTVEDLYAMQSGKSYALKCDIDLKGRAWTPLSVKNFDGNGHTIKNCTINETLTSDGGFFKRIEKLNNVTFDGVVGNISFIADDAQWLNGGVAAGLVYKEIKNVTVINSDVSFSIVKTDANATMVHVGGIAGEYSAGMATLSTGFTGVYDCTFENSNLSVTGKSVSLAVGGIVGSHSTKEFLNCSVVNSVINSNGTTGGIIGTLESSSIVQNCVFENSEIKSTGGWAGGILGSVFSNAKITECLASGGTIAVNSKGVYSVGGITGYSNEAIISDCLVNGMTLDCSTTSAKADDSCYVGGFCGTSGGTVSKSIVVDCKVSGTGSTSLKNVAAAGFIARVGGSVNNCAAYGVTVSGSKSDIFAPSGDTVFNSFVGEGSAPNANGLTVLNPSEWESILETMSLDSGIWTFDGGKPSLKNIKITNGE